MNMLLFLRLSALLWIGAITATAGPDELIASLRAAITPTSMWPQTRMAFTDRIAAMQAVFDEIGTRINTASNLITQIQQACAQSAQMQSAVVCAILFGYDTRRTNERTRDEQIVLDSLSSLLETCLRYAPSAYVACAETVLTEPHCRDTDVLMWQQGLDALHIVPEAEPHLTQLYQRLLHNTAAPFDVRLYAFVRLLRPAPPRPPRLTHAASTNWFAHLVRCATNDRDKVSVWSVGLIPDLYPDWSLSQLWIMARSSSWAQYDAVRQLEAHYQTDPRQSAIVQQLYDVQRFPLTNAQPCALLPPPWEVPAEQP